VLANDGSRSDMSRDFTAQGLGNLAGSFFQAMPAGGSLSRTGVNVSGGALTRWAGIYSGVLLAALLVLFGQYTELIPMSGLAAVLIFIGYEVVVREGKVLVEAWRVSRIYTAIAVITILVGVFSDLTAAIFAGVILSLLAFAFVSANKYKAVELVYNGDGLWEERAAPKQLTNSQATIIHLMGDLYFASVYSFDEVLPVPDSARNAVVIIQTRERSFESLTYLEWLRKYITKLRTAGNDCMLSGVENSLWKVLESAEIIDLLGEKHIFRVSPVIGASTGRALEAARQWIAMPDKPPLPAAASNGAE
jgi:SulP family sulfate permease